MTTKPAQQHEIRFQPAARRAIAQRLPESVAAAVLEFCDATLVSRERDSLTSVCRSRTMAYAVDCERGGSAARS
jgi:hypothetical protein